MTCLARRMDESDIFNNIDTGEIRLVLCAART